MNELGGWSRLGVVLSALWAILIFGIVYFEFSDSRRPSPGMFIEWADPKTGLKIVTFDGEFEKRADELGPFSNHPFVKRDQPYKRVYWSGVMPLLAIPIAIMWAIGLTIGWIAKGFRRG